MNVRGAIVHIDVVNMHRIVNTYTKIPAKHDRGEIGMVTDFLTLTLGQAWQGLPQYWFGRLPSSLLTVG